MFKLESYITPVILSYVEKYVKNFKPEQSQVSLWGGDASFQNLDLRLEVLEEQLNLPFTFVSGHIHELLIHVPWVKITSEPIVVTINTIECILKLKDKNLSDNISIYSAPKEVNIPQEETPPGYIKSIVTKVINNITINCNNLILKYVEEDIVLSINVRFLSMQTVNNKWEAAFTDISSYEVTLQKVIMIQDLTLCLDKMDTSGKIEIYQDPVLYRCSMVIRLIMSYHSNIAKRASITRLDLRCRKMEFSITEQQIPMILRLIALLTLLQSRQVPIVQEKTSTCSEEDCSSSKDESIQVSGAATDNSWGMWAWNTVSSFLPMDWQNDWSHDQHIAYSGHVIHFGFYIDDATITFKTVESVKEQLFYKSRKIKYKSFLSLRFTEAIFDTILQGISMTNFTIGFGGIRLYPRGTCSCGHFEVIDGVQPPLYLTAGKSQNNYLKDTLFDNDSLENQGKKKLYKKDISLYIASTDVYALLKRCPAFCMDYVHYTEIPDDITPEALAEFRSNYEYSNFIEERHIRYAVGNLTIRLCSGLFHRINTIKTAADKYDYSPYRAPKPILSFEELPPVTVEEYEALRERISMVKMELYIENSAIQLQLADHRITGLPRKRKYVENRTMPLTPALSEDPFVSIECDSITATLTEPLYPFRFVSCASKQTHIPPEMLEQCYRDIKVKLNGVNSQVFLKINCRTSIIMPCNIEYNLRMLLYPVYWTNLDTVHNLHNLQIDSITITGTKTKIMVASSIITSLLNPDDLTNPLLCSSLYTDACDEKSPIYIELFLENVKHELIMSICTTTCTINISAIKMFALHETEQVFILSGPEVKSSGSENDQLLIKAVIQFSKEYNNQRHPTILSFDIASMKGCLDPLILQWLSYRVTYYKLNTTHAMKPESTLHAAESVISDVCTKKRTFPSLHESVHSSSDKEKKKAEEGLEKSKKNLINKSSEPDKVLEGGTIEENTSILRKVAKLYPWWSGLVLSGSMDHIIIYIPTETMSGIGVEGIEEAKDHALKNNPDLRILAIKLPTVNVHSLQIQSEHLFTYLRKLPIVLPKNMWIHQIHSFPWTLEISNFESFTLRSNSRCNFIKKVCFKATFHLTIQNPASDSTKNELPTLSLCLYIETSPVIISISDEQVIFLYNALAVIVNLIKIVLQRQDTCSVGVKEVKDASLGIPRRSPSPTQLPYAENQSTSTSTLSGMKDNVARDDEDLHLTASIQWTITKVSAKLYIMAGRAYSTLKLVLDLEDIITSVNIQSVYLKIKHKITSATIFHYTRATELQQWHFGDYVGLVLCGRDDNFEKSEDSGFMTLTLTIAKAGNVHFRWGAHKTYNTKKRDAGIESLHPSNAYITEAVIKIQPIDIIVPPSVLAKYMQFIAPFLNKTLVQKNCPNIERNISTSFIGFTNLRNDSLPLIYLEFKGFRLMLPVFSQSTDFLHHDLLMLKLDDIQITPHADNPICREPIRSDIYQLAAQANILNVPGSAVEDRQYQINVVGICAHTTTWKNYQQSVAKRMSQSYLYTMNENPAVEWNKLDNESSLESHFSTLPVITSFDFCFIIAPAIIFKPDVIVCGSAAEINCETDLELMVNLNQIKLFLSLCSQFKSLAVTDDVDDVSVTDTLSRTKKTKLSFSSKSTISKKYTIFESETEFTKDSGIDFETSSISSLNAEKPLFRESLDLPPFEFLINCGKIKMIIYDVKEATSFKNNEVERANDDVNNLKQPLLYAMINQPNFYFSQHVDQKLQVSFFDVALCLGNTVEECSTCIPSESDFKVCLIETKNGEAHPDTGIPPSFLVIRRDVLLGKIPQLSIDFGRPTKVHISLCRLNTILYIGDKISACFNEASLITFSPMANNATSLYLNASAETPSAGSQRSVAARKINIPDISVTSQQFVVSFKSCTDAEVMFSLAMLSINISNVLRPERIYVNLTWDAFIVSTILDSKITVLLNPLSCNVTVSIMWESWQNEANSPQIQIQIDSECIYLDFGPKHILILNSVLPEFKEVIAKINSMCDYNSYDDEMQSILHHEQHYKDDLKSGAFQFVDGNEEELPFPYQVVFFSSLQQAMAWRYPHPRALTKIYVCPVPFETDNTEVRGEDRIACAIEFWSESQMAYQRYVELYISETESYRLDLPDRIPLQAVACIWRIVILPNSESSKNLSSKTLIGCIRVDSYFNPLIVPKIQAAVSIRGFYMSFYNHLDLNYYKSLPPPLNNYKLSGMIPETQCFALLEHKETTILFNRWTDNSLLFSFSGNISLYLLDYGLLLLQEVLDKAMIKAQVSIVDNIDLTINCQPFSIKLSPSTFHTLALAANLWNNMLNTEDKLNVVLTTRYVIANNTNIPIRFGQNGTDDNILLESRQCYFYSWRIMTNQVLRISIEESSWTWSKPFSMNVDGTYYVEFINSGLEMVISVKIKPLSASEKLITFFGQLLILNHTFDSFEMKLIKYDSTTSNKSFIYRDILTIPANSQPPSIVLLHNGNLAMRLRFNNIANLAWTGDIPLQPNTRWGQPWLVKVPLEEKGQFISIWVRIIIEQVNERNKILAIISPLYMIRSYLPVSAKVQIETPTLQVSLNTVINGRGEKQQLYCPGTFEHFHHLTFQIESGISASNPYVPLSYDSVDQRKFFKRPEKENIDEVLASLESEKEESKWPFQIEDPGVWIAAEQPQTHVQVKYEDAGLASSTLLLELLPWCFILNSLGTQISIVFEDVELCRIPHYGIVAPPKLDGLFHIGLGINNTFFMSSALQLVIAGWSKNFYMSRLEGLIPIEGNMKTSVTCDSSVCMMSITSCIYKDIRTIRISSNYVIGNMTKYELYVAAFAVPNSSTDLCLPNDLTLQSICISPSVDEKCAIPIIQWYTLYEKINESFVLYITIGIDNQSWSCPVRVDYNLSRRSIALPHSQGSVPLLLTTQEDKNAIYIMIHKDKYPQLFIENLCSFDILVSETNKETGDIILDAPHFSWKCQIDSKRSCYYSMPTAGSKLPDLPNDDEYCMIVSTIPAIEEFQDKINFGKKNLQWSKHINLSISPIEQFVRLPHHGDVKLTMKKRCYTTFITFSPVLQVEISAQEIRNKIERKYNLQSEESDVIAENFPPYVEEEKAPLNLQSASSSASTITFFSAQEDNLEIDSSHACECSINSLSIANKLHTLNSNLLFVDEYKEKKMKWGSATIHLQGFSIIIVKDVNDNAQRIEVASLCMIDVILMLDHRLNNSKFSMYIGDMQLDNQMFDQGGFDFPVVLISESPFVKKDSAIYLINSLRKNIKNVIENSLMNIDIIWEHGYDEKVCKEVVIKISPIRAYIEGSYLTLLKDYAVSALPPCFLVSISNIKEQRVDLSATNGVCVPDYILLDAKTLTYPLMLESLMIEPLSIMLSVHTSVHLYVAFDHSPLYFESFDKKNLIATPYRLGNALAMHYLSGAIFGIGWVVGSLDILGSPGGLAQALGSGLKDFISMPFQGLLQGPWGFIVGITHGSASLLKHITAGTVNSVTKLASSVARNLDRLTLDEEHLQRQEEFRRMRPQGVTQGFYQGLSGLGMSLLAAVAGLAHHPLQQVWSGETSTRGLVKGVSRGLVGVVTKPLSGAAELVALTGQGLLQRTGWNSLPAPRQRPVVQYTNGSGMTSLRYAWRLMSLLWKSNDSILHVSNAEQILDSNQAVILVLTRQALLIVDAAADSVEKIFPLKDLIAADHPSEPSMFKFYCSTALPLQHFKRASPNEQIDMDQEMRARVAEFLRTSSTGIASVSTNSDAQSEIVHDLGTSPSNDNSFIFYINSDSRSYLLSIFNAAKRQSQNCGFVVL